MTKKSPMRRHASSMRRHVVVVAKERNSAWRHVVGLLESRAHLMVGSSAGVEVVVEKVRREFFPVVARFSDDGRRFL